VLDVRISVWAISYGGDGRQIYRKKVGTIGGPTSSTEFAFAPHPNGDRFDIAVHISKANTAVDIGLNKIEVRYKFAAKR
jgi:hypothetical protein